MLQNNYLRIATCVPKVHLGNPMKNVEEITKMISQIKDASIILFPELAITGYSIGDWMTNNELLEQANLALDTLVQSSNQQIIIVGGPLQYNSKLYNVAYVIQNKKIIGAVPKMHLPSYREFFERRIFESGSEFYKESVIVKQGNYEFPFGELLFDSEFVKFGIEICEDLWQNNAPHIDLYDNGAHIVFNLSTSTFQINKSERRRMICDNASFLGSGAYVYTSTGISETSSDILYSGHMIVCECGEVLVDDESLSKEENFHIVDIDLEMINYNRRVLNTTNHTDYNHLSKVSFNLRPELEVLLPIKREISSFPFSLKTNKNKQDVIDVVSTALYHRLKHIGIKKVV
ncbi:MAG: nitrilase-related carbon-nitrogen hydrolase, partial [Bacilli bacterium]